MDDDWFDDFDWTDMSIIGSFVDYMSEEEDEDERRRRKIEQDMYSDAIDDFDDETDDPEKYIP